MKWIGQNIYDQISRFRNDVYLEDISTGTIANGGHLGLDSNNKIVKAVDGGGDLTSIEAGTGLSGGGTSGAVTLSVDASQPSITTLAGVSAIGTAGTPITITSDTVTFTSANADDPLIKILNTTDNDQGARLFLWKERTDSSIQGGEADDEIGALYFYGYDSAAQLQGYGKIETFIDVATHGQESGIMQLGVASHDGGSNNGLYMRGGSVDTEVNVTVGNGTASTTTIAGTLTMGSTAFVNNSGVVQVATQGTIDHDSLANFVTAEHVDWAGASAGTIHSTNIPTLNQNTTGTAATVTGAAQTNITSLGTLTALTVDNININSDTITSQGDLAIVATGNDITVDTDNFTIESSGSHLPLFKIKSTSNGNDGGYLTFHKDRGAAQVNDDKIGSITWVGENDAEEENIYYGQIQVSALEVDDTDEAGRMKFQVAESNGSVSGLTTGLTIEGSDNTTDGEVNVTIAAGVSSTTTVAGNLYARGGLFSYENESLSLTSAITSKPGLVISNSNTDAAAPSIRLQKTATGADGDDIGQILFHGDNSNDIVAEYVKILGEIETALPTDEAGKLSILTRCSDGNSSAIQQAFTATGHGTNNTVDIGLGYGAASTTTVAGDLTVTSASQFNGALTFGVDDTGHNVKFFGATSGKYLLWDESDNQLEFTDDTYASFGNSADLKIFHTASGNNSFITNITGDLVISQGTNDGDLKLECDDGSGGTTTYVTLDGSAGKVVINKPSQRTFGVSSSTDGDANGDIVYFGDTTSMTVGKIYHYKSDGSWEIVNADAVATSDGLLAVALGAASDTNGMLLRGMVTLDHDPGAIGDVLYIQSDNAGTPGNATATAPSASGDCVRIVGYQVKHASNGNIWFNPDSTFVEVA